MAHGEPFGETLHCQRGLPAFRPTVDADGKARLVGDVAADEVGHAAWLTPVPGGVGPMTIACLLANTATAARANLCQKAA